MQFVEAKASCALANTILNYEEKTLAVNVFSDQSDETCAVWLEKLQREYKLTAMCGFIPAALFHTAIMETSGKAAEDSNSPTIKQFFARGTKTLDRVNVSGSTTVDISSIRSMNVCFVGDSGCNFYASKKVHAPGQQMREVGGWTNLCTAGVVGGTTIKHFGEYLARQRVEQSHYLVSGVEGIIKFPDSWTVRV